MCLVNLVVFVNLIVFVHLVVAVLLFITVVIAAVTVTIGRRGGGGGRGELGWVRVDWGEKRWIKMDESGWIRIGRGGLG